MNKSPVKSADQHKVRMYLCIETKMKLMKLYRVRTSKLIHLSFPPLTWLDCRVIQGNYSMYIYFCVCLSAREIGRGREEKKQIKPIMTHACLIDPQDPG